MLQNGGHTALNCSNRWPIPFVRVETCLLQPRAIGLSVGCLGAAGGIVGHRVPDCNTGVVRWEMARLQRAVRLGHSLCTVPVHAAGRTAPCIGTQSRFLSLDRGHRARGGGCTLHCLQPAVRRGDV